PDATLVDVPTATAVMDVPRPSTTVLPTPPPPGTEVVPRHEPRRGILALILALLVVAAVITVAAVIGRSHNKGTVATSSAARAVIADRLRRVAAQVGDPE